MIDQNLILNILTFNQPVETIDVSFSTEAAIGLFPIYKKEWPLNISELFPDLDFTTEYLYVNFEPFHDDSTLSVNLPQNPRFSKHYYNWLIASYFSKVADVSKPNFINDNVFWFWEKENEDKDYYIFKKYSVRVQVNRIVASPCLIISYEGKSKLFKSGLDKLNLPVEDIKKVIYKHKLYQYDELTDEVKQDLPNVRPVLNNEIRSSLKLGWDSNLNPNKLKSFYKEISYFVNTYLDTPAFKAIIPLTSAEFIQVPETSISKTTQGSNQLIFGNDKSDLSPFMGMVKYGPYKPTTLNKIEFILIFHENNRNTAETLLKWQEGNEIKKISSLKNFIKMNYYVDIDKSIVFQDLENPLPEIQQQLENWPRISGTTYLGIYITPFPKEETNIDAHSIYFKIKYELLKYRISSQVIEVDTIHSPAFQWSLPNIAIAICAKLGGIPWRLKRTTYNELIVGVGAFKPANKSGKYIGSSFCFSNDGHFQNFACYSAYSTKILAGSIRDSVIDFREKNRKVERLVIHFYKRMGREDLDPIKKVLHKLGLDIPVIIIHVNKTESRDLVVFDQACPYEKMIPESGTFIKLDANQFLLCNNTRYGDQMPGSRDGYPFPVKLTIQSSDMKILEDEKLINDLIDQVYQFSRMYWTSVTQQNLPVTVKYPEMVAEKYPHFEHGLPPFGQNNLWFL